MVNSNDLSEPKVVGEDGVKREKVGERVKRGRLRVKGEEVESIE